MERIPNRQELAKYSVNRQGYEAITQSLYDTQAYAAAGQTNLQFFQVPQGQSSKTLSDTNMQLAGQLPAGQEFLIQSIELLFLPTRPTVAAQMPAAFGAQAIAQIVNDAYLFAAGGNLQLNVLSKTYLQEAPLGRFPSKTNFEVSAALADVTTAGANLQSRIAFGKSCGRPYILKAPILLISTQNFSVTLNWPEGVVAITNPARVVCVLDGIMYRKSQ